MKAKTQKDVDDAFRALLSESKNQKPKRYYTPHQQPIHKPEVGIEEPITRNGAQQYSPSYNRQTSRQPRNPVVVCRLQKRTIQMFEHLVVVAILLTIGNLMLHMPSDPTMIMSSPVFIPAIMAFIGIFFGWQFLSNKLVWQIEEVPNKYIPRKNSTSVTKVVKEDTNIVKENYIPKTIRVSKEVREPITSSMSNSMNSNAVSYTIVLVGLVTLSMLIIWSIDMSITALMLQASGLGATLSNGFRLMDPSQQYHMSIGALIIVMLMFFFIALKIQQENKPQKESILKLNIPKLPFKAPSPVVFNMISNFMVIPIMGFMVLTFILASNNPQYVVIHTFNKLGEGFPELVMVCVIFIMTLINAQWSVKLYRANRKRILK